ncbi:Nn.00g006830.m01.CDS01 [Neocucurbitaria sp. VM-36]
MPPTRVSKKSAPTPNSEPVHDTVTYPRIEVTAENDSCLNSSTPCEHILACGHIVITAKPNEPCAPNCHHVGNGNGEPSNTGKKGNRYNLSKKNFYCDACIESRNEGFIPHSATSAKAEKLRAEMRRTEGEKRNKGTQYRKCYIGLKVVSISCDTDGALPSSYKPRLPHHPFDTAVPQTGDNMFDDMDMDPEESLDETEEESSAAKVIEIPSSSSTEEEIESVADEGVSDAQMSEEEGSGSQTSTVLPIRGTTPITVTSSSPQALASVRTRILARTHARRAATDSVARKSSPPEPTATPQVARKRKIQVVVDSDDDSDDMEDQAKRVRDRIDRLSKRIAKR